MLDEEDVRCVCVLRIICILYYILYILYFIYNKTLAIRKDKILPFLTMWMDLEDYHANKHKSDGKEWRAYDFTHMWDIKQEATNKLTKQRHKFTDTGNRRWLPEGNKVGGQTYGDGGRLDFAWWAHNATYRWRVTELYTWNI